MKTLFAFFGLLCPLLRGQLALDYSTYLGGAGDDFANSVAVDSAGNTYVTGTTSSIGFPFAPSEMAGYYDFDYDSLLVKLAPDGSLVFAKKIANGGVRTMLVDPEGNAYLAGQTTRQAFEITPKSFQAASAAAGQAFVIKITPDGSTVFSSYLGGNGSTATTIAIDGSGAIVVCGRARPGFIPITDSALQKTAPANTLVGFCSQLSADGSQLLFSTLVGGSGLTVPMSSAIDQDGKLVLAGSTSSTDFPLKSAYGSADSRKTLFRLNRGAQTWTAVGNSFPWQRPVDPISGQFRSDAIRLRLGNRDQ